MSEDDEPKSAYELAMERLRKKDAESGAESRPLTDEQRAAIAEVRDLRQKIEGVRHDLEKAERDYDLNRLAELKHGKLPLTDPVNVPEPMFWMLKVRSS